MKNMIEPLVENAASLYRDMHTERKAPSQADTTRWTDAVRRGRIFFYGTREVEIGLAGIDWSGAHVAHQEWPAQLNRFFCLPYLCAAFKQSGDIQIPRLARMLIEDWIAQHDYAADKPIAKGDNTLNLSIRLGQSGGRGWWPAIADFNCPDVFDEPFLQRIADSCRGQLAYLRSHLAAKGNWRISHLDTILTLSLLLPEAFGDNREFAVRQLNETFHRQIHADGSHEEHNPSYHGWMCQVFTALWRLSVARPGLGLHLDGERVARMWDYALFSTAPDGGSFGLHDGECWRRRSAPPAATVVAIPDSLLSLRTARRAIIHAAGLDIPEQDEETTPSRYFAAAGQVFLRSGFGKDTEMVSFDATRWGGSHCHLSRNAISVFSGGRMLLADPGLFTYERSDPFLAFGKSTPAHNTLTLDLMSQAETNPDLHDIALLGDAAVVSCTYAGGYYPGTYRWNWEDGKHPGLFAAHTRTLLWLSKRCLLVWDHARFDRPGQMYGIHWQFPIGPSGCDAQTGRTWSASDSERNILVQELAKDNPMNTFIAEGNGTTPAGWLPTDASGARVPAPQARYHANASRGTTTACFLLLPFDGTTPPAILPAKLEGRAGVHGFRFALPDGTELLVAAADALGQQIECAGPLTTDASLVAVTLRDGRPVHSVGFGGMFLAMDGRMLVDKKNAEPWSLAHGQ